jgi:hypothetical protein
VVSIADAGGVVVDANGASTTGRTTGNVTVTITGFPTSLQSTTLGAGLGLQVQTTTTLNTYTYHKLIAKEADVKQLSDDINDFQARYRVSDNAPTTDLDEGDLWYDKTANKMKVYDTSTSAWKEVQSVGSFFINTLSSSSGTGGGSATFNGSAYRFTLSNAGASAQQMLVSVNGVIQKPNSGTSQPSEGFAIQNNDIIFAAAPASGASHFIVTIGSTVNVGQPSANTVDTSELVDGAVTNAKVSSSAAIAGTKISPDFGSQNVLTTGNVLVGTTDSTIYNNGDSDSEGIVLRDGEVIDIARKGDLQLTLNRQTNDGHHIGFFRSGSAKSYIATRSDGFCIDVNSSERLRINSSGRLLVGTTTTSVHGDRLIEIGNTSRSATFQAITTSTSGTGGIVFADTTTNDTGGYRGSIQYAHSSDSLRFNTAATQQMLIDSSGNVAIGSTTAPDKLNVGSTSNGFTAIRILTSSDGNGEVRFGDAGSGNAGYIRYAHNGNNLIFARDNTEAMRISSSGNVGIGVSSPFGKLQVKAGTDANFVHTTASSEASLEIINDAGSANVPLNVRASEYKVKIQGTERLRIDSSGRLLVGTNSDVSGGLSTTLIQGVAAGGGFVGLARNDTSVFNGSGIGGLRFYANDPSSYNDVGIIQCVADGTHAANDYPTRLEFHVTGDNASSPTERLRINNLGFVKAGPRITDSSHGVADLDSARHEFTSDNNGWTMIVTHTSGAASEHEGILINYANSPNGTGNSFIQGNDSNGLKFRFASNGGLYNVQSNDSNVSDEREKKNIVSLDTKWDKVKSWDLKKFHYNDDADDDDLRYGVIAQQVEEHCPEVLTEWVKQPAKEAVLDEDGNVVTPAVAEVTRKGVKEQQMMWMAIKALQEAQTRIESLETQNASLEARLTALEGAS